MKTNDICGLLQQEIQFHKNDFVTAGLVHFFLRLIVAKMSITIVNGIIMLVIAGILLYQLPTTDV